MALEVVCRFVPSVSAVTCTRMSLLWRRAGSGSTGRSRRSGRRRRSARRRSVRRFVMAVRGWSQDPRRVLFGRLGSGPSAAAPAAPPVVAAGSGQEALDQLNAQRLSSALAALARLAGAPARRGPFILSRERLARTPLADSDVLRAYFAEHPDDALAQTYRRLAGWGTGGKAAGQNMFRSRWGPPMGSWVSSRFRPLPPSYPGDVMWQPSPSGGGVSAPQVPVATLPEPQVPLTSGGVGVQASPLAVTPAGPMFYPPGPTSPLFGSRDPGRR